MARVRTRDLVEESSIHYHWSTSLIMVKVDINTYLYPHCHVDSHEEHMNSSSLSF
jgi:hypothetical protein